MNPKATYFANAEEFRRWLAAHAATASELLVGLKKRFGPFVRACAESRNL
jgi:hypothetical protein